MKKNRTLLSASSLADHFSVTKYQINPILSELGLLKKQGLGWELTPIGVQAGGVQRKNKHKDVLFVVWKEEILQNQTVQQAFSSYKGEPKKDFRSSFEAPFRAQDGHYVRSKAEMLIDNWLYMSGIVHAYERQLPIEEDMYCDFYLPNGKVYIEYWGLEENEKYQNRKKEKCRLYQKYRFHLLELTDQDIQQLDDVFPKKLLKFGIQAF